MRAEFLNPGTIGILGQPHKSGCAVHCRVFSNVFGLFSLDISVIAHLPAPGVTKNISIHCQMSRGGGGGEQNWLQLRTEKGIVLEVGDRSHI